MIEKAWKELLDGCLYGASALQKREMKKAFYAGAATVFHELMGTTSEEAQIKMLDSLNKELIDFFQVEMPRDHRDGRSN